jgi:uncharacterized membrane protein YdjX (TVP38/TMEM64 family)
VLESAPAEETGLLRRLVPWEPRISKPRFGAKYKLALGAVFFGSFLVAGGLFMADEERMRSWGYLGGFVISLVSSATVVVPAPGAVLILQMAETLNPFILGVVTGIAGGIGGFTAYLAGAAGGKAINESRLGALMARLFQTKLGPVLLFTFNLVPFMPGDALSAIAGVIRYPLPKYFLFVTTSTIIKMIILCLLGAYATGLAERLL